MQHFNHYNLPEVQHWKYKRLVKRFKINIMTLLTYWLLWPQELQNLPPVPFYETKCLLVKDTANTWCLHNKYKQSSYFTVPDFHEDLKHQGFLGSPDLRSSLFCKISIMTIIFNITLKSIFHFPVSKKISLFYLTRVTEKQQNFEPWKKVDR